ncbi:MAG: hypothetical protein IJ588_11945 [Prevotella sp.]|nr:hypothetical protein [Prevotella sp.]
MKKILMFAIMLLNLLPNIEDGNMKIGTSTISAQILGFEGLPYRCNDDVIGWYSSPIPCDDEPCVTACLVYNCDWSGPCDELDSHMAFDHDSDSSTGNDDEAGIGFWGDEGQENGNDNNGNTDGQGYDISGWTPDWHPGGTPSSPYKQFGAYDIVISTKLLKQYVRQENRFSCVVTTMEYASGILNPNNIYSRSNFRYTMHELYPSSFSYGIPSSVVENFMNVVFDNHRINTYEQLKNEIDSHHPVIGRIDGTIVAPYNPIDHMVLAIGYSVINPYSIICIDPGTGGYRTISYLDFNGDFFALTQLKPNFR